MGVSVDDVARRLRREAARREAEAEARSAALRARLPAAVEVLREAGAVRVWLFGSLAPTPGSESRFGPALLAPETYVALRKLLAFRLFFRHAYAVSLDRAQLADLRRVAVDARGGLGRDLDAADAFLAELAKALRD